jgi:tetratricopeptide (TPR) repeat protein
VAGGGVERAGPVVRTIAATAAVGDDHVGQRRAAGKVVHPTAGAEGQIAGEGHVSQHLFGSERTITAARQALTLTNDPRLRVLIHGQLARGLSGNTRWEAALELIANEPNTNVLRLHILKGLGLAHIRYGNYGKAFSYSQEGLPLVQKTQARIYEDDLLLDCGLAAWFAGIYPEALKFNHAALALAEETGDREAVGLLKANLGMTYRNAGDLLLSLKIGTEAVDLLNELGVKRMEGQARNREGNTLLALERWQEADDMYAAALEVWAPLNNPNIYEAKAGRAVTALGLGHQPNPYNWWTISWPSP